MTVISLIRKGHVLGLRKQETDTVVLLTI